MIDLSNSISVIKGVGKKRAETFSKLGIYTVNDLLCFYPRQYEDWSKIYKIHEAPLDINVCISAYVASEVTEHPIRKGMTTYSFDVTDGISMMNVVFFNNKYIKSMIVKGNQYLFWGKLSAFRGRHLSMNSPQFIKEDNNSYIPLRPVYPQKSGLSTLQIEKTIKSAFELISDCEDCLPDKIKNDYCLMSRYEALRNIHFPENADLLEEAKRRIAFEELFLLQIGLMRLKEKNRKSESVPLTNDYTKEFIESLPFEMTDAQKRAVSDCVSDMSCGKPMNRLIQGDVGSGKTAVCAAVIYSVIKSGYQAVLMAPTEVLARQHFKTFISFFKGTNINVALLTGQISQAEKKSIKSRVENGEIQLLIGTHAVIQKDVVFQNLGLAVTDEQHRFGVNQRNMLTKKGKNPHVLVMSATPIPRTLSLIIYGDLDLSIIDQMPKGRQKIDTFLIDGTIRERAYSYVKKHLCEGRQGYIICPLIEENEDEDSDIAASVSIYKDLSEGYFKGFRLGLLHGKLSSSEKKSVFERFSSGDIDLLVSTTVVEVGVDVPNAVIMVIENAEFFGLSQLHQLRGRIGRGEYKSTCILISDNNDSERLKILTKTSDGFLIADEDLRLRGPGDFFGSRQSGLPNLKTAGFITDGEAIREAHTAAERLLKENPDLKGNEYDNLKKQVNALFSSGIAMN